MGEMNNRRAEWADRAVIAFRITTGTDREDAIADLLCDLMHLCDEEQGETFAQCLTRAAMNYDAEKADDK